MSNKIHILFWLFVVTLAAFVIISLFSISNNLSEHDRLYFSIQGFSVENNDSITIGRNSNMSYRGLPHDYMTVKKMPDGKYSWKINEQYSDSLFYYKVGNKNPNLNDVVSGDIVKVDDKLIDADAVNSVFDQCTEMEYYLKRKQSVKYIMVRNIIAKELGDTSYLNRYDIKSFFWRETPSAQLKFCVLDNKCKIRKVDGEERGYCYDGIISADSCKLQFYTMSENAFVSLKDNAGFTINDLCYTAKPILLTTEWGAGHIKFESPANEDKIAVFFPKAITLVESIDGIVEGIKEDEAINIVQDIGSFPIDNSIRIPFFSNICNMDVCSINIAEDSLSLNDNCGKSYKVKSQHRFTPDFESIDLPTGRGTLKCKCGLIDRKFLRSFVHLPLLVFVWFVVFFVILLKRTRNMNETERGQRRINVVRTIIALCVFALAFAYCIGKTFIAIKLSFTYPYFEKIAGVNVVSVSLILVLVFALYSLFSQRFFRYVDNNMAVQRRKRISTNILSFIFPLVAFLSILGIWRFHVDAGFSLNMLESYMSSDLYSWNIWNWFDLIGMNDTHRNILYTISLFLILAIFILFLLQIAKIRAITGKIVDGLLSKIKFNRNTGRQRRFHNGNDANKTKMIGYIIITALLLFMCWFIPGNFATALISLVLVFGLSKTLARLDYGNPKLTVITIVVLIPIMVFLSVIPDKGYVTNWWLLGIPFAIFWIMLLNSIVRLNNDINETRRNNYIKSSLIGGVVLLLIVFTGWFLLKKTGSDYDRTNRRFDLVLNYKDVKDKGYRYSESDVEFMVIMSHYMQNNNGEDPLSNEKHLLHPSISTGQSPVVLNDVSIQSAFFSAYGGMSKVLYFALQLLLLLFVCYYALISSIRKTSVGRTGFDCSVRTVDVRRILAVFMWVGTSLYLYLSYCGYLPFTGRLNPGFGVDSVGEALESALLVAFMMSEDVE